MIKLNDHIKDNDEVNYDYESSNILSNNLDDIIIFYFLKFKFFHIKFFKYSRVVQFF